MGGSIRSNLPPIPPNPLITRVLIPQREAYSGEDAESFVYRRETDGSKWEVILDDLCKPTGTTMTTLTLNPEG